MELLELLKKKQNLLNISGLEKELRIPDTTISRYMRTGYIPKKWKDKLEAWFRANLAEVN